MTDQQQHDQEQQPTHTYRAAQMLTEQWPPKLRGRAPFWRPKAPAEIKGAHVPVFNWMAPDADPGAPTATLDINGAFLAAAASAVFAHGAVEYRGRQPIKAPGLYQITAHGWTESGMPSPLGTQPREDGRIWVAHPTAILLEELSEDGWWPEVEVHDAVTADTSCRLRSWTTAVKADRTSALHRRELLRQDVQRGVLDPDATDLADAEADYQAIKDGYAIAVQLMRGPGEGGKVKSKMYRPDWYATIHAQHAASMWRKAWRTYLAGCGPVAMRDVDTVTWRSDHLAALLEEPRRIPYDPSGVSLGAFKIKSEE